MRKDGFPTNATLEEAVIDALKEIGGTATTAQINDKVIEILDLPEEIVNLEDESGLGTKLNYRLRWARTNLKKNNRIENVSKGTWTLV